MSARKINKASIEILILTSFLVVLFLSAINIGRYLAPVKVLGVKTQENTDQIFWQEFLDKNPNYIPGWIETGRIDKVKEIDPNYELESGR